MEVELKVEHGCLYGRPVEEADLERIVDGMVANGADRESYEEWPLFVQGEENVQNALSSLYDIGYGVEPEEVLDAPGPVVTTVEDWTFRHLCGYQSD